jgi:WD40 repeat protein
VRVPDEVGLGQARVTIDLEGWPQGRVVPSTYQLPVVPRNPLPSIKVSPEQLCVWSADGYSVDELRYAPDGKTLVVVMTKRALGERLYQFRLWDAATGKERCKCLQIDPEPLKAIYTPYLAISADSKFLVVRYNLLRFIKEDKRYRDEESGQLHVFDLQTGRQLWHHDGEGWGILGAAFSPDGKTLVTGHTFCKKTGEGREQKREFFGEVRFWDTCTGQKKVSLPGGPYQIIWSVEYSRDARYVVFQDEHRGKETAHYLGVWDISAQKLALKVPGQNQLAVFSPGGTQLATSTSTWTGQEKTYHKAVKVWELQTGKEKAMLSLPTGEGWLSGLTWSADGKYLFLSSTAGQLWRWDPAGTEPPITGESIISDPSAKQPARDARNRDVHLGSALYAFGVNGKLPERITRRNLADDYDELPPPQIILWNLKTMQRRGTLTGHRGRINHIAFSPDGAMLVSGGTDGTIRFWSMAGFQGR